MKYISILLAAIIVGFIPRDIRAQQVEKADIKETPAHHRRSHSGKGKYHSSFRLFKRDNPNLKCQYPDKANKFYPEPSHRIN